MTAAALVGPASPGVVQSEIDGRIQLFAPDAVRAYVLNDSASEVWRLADGSRSLAEVVETLARAYAVPAPAIAADVATAVADLRAHGLLLP